MLLEDELNDSLIKLEDHVLSESSSDCRSFSDRLIGFYSEVWNVVSLSVIENCVFDYESRLKDLVSAKSGAYLTLGFWELHRILSDLGLFKLPLSLGKLRLFWLSFSASKKVGHTRVSYLEQTEIFKSHRICGTEFMFLLTCLFCHAFTNRVPANETLAGSIRRFLTSRIDCDYFKNVYRDYLLDPKVYLSKNALIPKSPLRVVPFERLLHPQTDQVIEYLCAQRRMSSGPRYIMRNVSDQSVKVRLLSGSFRTGVKQCSGLAPGASLGVFLDEGKSDESIEFEARASSGLCMQSRLCKA